MALSRNPLPLALAEMGVTEAQFKYTSPIHGPSHVNRVIYLAMMLCRQHGHGLVMPEVWAAAYLHDLARLDDEPDDMHGHRAVAEYLHQYEDLFIRAGVRDMQAVAFAVAYHCTPLEATPVGGKADLVLRILKDADALDRVRIGDLNPKMLRLEYSAGLIKRARALFAATTAIHDFEHVWKVGVFLFNPAIGLAERVKDEWHWDETGDQRMQRRLAQAQVGKPPMKVPSLAEVVENFPRYKDQLGETPPALLNELRLVLTTIVSQGFPVTYVRPETLEQVCNGDRKFRSLWELPEATWHRQFNDNPEDGRAYNEHRLFGEKCRWMTSGVFLIPDDRWMRWVERDQRLRQMYGMARIRWRQDVLASCSYTISDSQRNAFAQPFSYERVACSLATCMLPPEAMLRSIFAPSQENLRYFEIQIHEPLTVDDILAVE